MAVEINSGASADGARCSGTGRGGNQQKRFATVADLRAVPQKWDEGVSIEDRFEKSDANAAASEPGLEDETDLVVGLDSHARELDVCLALVVEGLGVGATDGERRNLCEIDEAQSHEILALGLGVFQNTGDAVHRTSLGRARIV